MSLASNYDIGDMHHAGWSRENSRVVAADPMMAYLSVGAVRADAVFVSGLQHGDEPSASQVRQAVTAAIRAFGCSGCAGRVAQEFGDHPETAVIRMRWARGVARQVFGDSPEIERCLRSLLYMRRLTLLPRSQADAGEAVT
jgi:radical SAM superfamily enzyme with C-terminal helix-hairpin-helix motif